MRFTRNFQAISNQNKAKRYFNTHRLMGVWTRGRLIGFTLAMGWSWKLAALEVEWNLTVAERVQEMLVLSCHHWAQGNFGLIQTLKNWTWKSVAMAFAFSAVEEIELKTQAALAGHELLLIMTVVHWSYSCLKWHTKAVAFRLHLPRRSRLTMTGCSCVLWPLQSTTDVSFLQTAHNRFASAVACELFVAALS